MIKSWKHKGLKAFYETGSTKGIASQHSRRLKALLHLLDSANSAEVLVGYPGLHMHALTGRQKNLYSVRVSGNWRLVFGFENEDIVKIDYLDYH